MDGKSAADVVLGRSRKDDEILLDDVAVGDYRAESWIPGHHHEL